ncbi:MAG: TIGR02186 family protein [Defluviicoccus sp.]
MIALRRLCCLLIALAILAAPRTTAAELVAALSNHLVAITTGFAGTEVLLFGTAGDSGDVVVVIRGPEEPHVVRRKGRRFGIWLNEKEMRFENVPAFYAVAASNPLDVFLPDRVATRHQIGVSNIRLMPAAGTASDDLNDFRAGLIRNKQNINLYATKTAAVTFLGGRLFRTDMYIPANAPVGTYTVGVYLVRDEDVVSAEITPLIVSKVGFEARLSDFAKRFSLAYGILAIVIATVAGWLANLVFRRG